jgi:histidinol-phosphate aminotransferase
MSVLDLARDDVRSLPLYSVEADSGAIDLGDNTNLWGSPPAARRALSDAPPPLSAYPTLYSAPLKDAILRHVGLEPGAGIGVVTGCGSDDVLDAVMRAFSRPGARIAYPSPTFSMIPVFARLNGIEAVPVPLTAELDADAGRIVDARAAITYLCTPNNPTATRLSRAAVEHVAAHAHGVVVIDEADAEFAPEVFVDLVSRHEHVLVARTFSKAFGLAGLRVGYGIASDELVGLLERARGPFKVNSFAERAVVATLGEGDDALGWVRGRALEAIGVRERLAGELQRRGFAPLPSVANFLCVPTARAVQLASRLRERGVLVRVVSGMPREVPAFDAEEGLALRLGVGPWDVMQRFLDALDGVMR